MSKNKKELQDFYNHSADSREKWKRRNRFYHHSLERYYSFIIPEKSRGLEIGCGLGDLLHAVSPEYGVGIDFAPAILKQARKKYPELIFYSADAEKLTTDETFDYIILSDLVGCLWDVQKVLHNLKKVCHPRTRLVISNFNFLWEPFIILGEKLHIKLSQPKQNWLSIADLDNLLQLEGFQIVTVQKKLLLPKYISGFNFLFNRVFANLPLINSLDLVNLIIARLLTEGEMEHSVSIIIPARNERGNIEDAIKRTNSFGVSQEFIFVEGHSTNQTHEEMLQVKENQIHLNPEKSNLYPFNKQNAHKKK
jgi:SAM-dependent methyltransferase